MASIATRIRKNLADISAVVIVLFSTSIMFASSWDDSPNFDEVEHIAAGYYYVTTQNYWLNPFHPPLIKDIAGWAVQCLRPIPPYTDSRQWRLRNKRVVKMFWWEYPRAQDMLRVARAPMIVIANLFLLYFFRRVKKEFGAKAALIALLMLSMSPTYLAHGRFVTTDIGATICFFYCSFCYFDYLKKQTTTNMLKVSVLTGIALLVKHSLLVLPFLYCLYFAIFQMTRPNEDAGKEPQAKRLQTAAWHIAMFSVISFAILYFGYLANMANLKPEIQKSYNGAQFEKMDDDPRVRWVRSTEDIPVLRPVSWYLTGLVGQAVHVEKGHGTSYLNGKLYRGGNAWFHPTLLSTKEPIGFLVLIFISAALGLLRLFFQVNNYFAQVRQSGNKPSLDDLIKATKKGIHDNYAVVASLTFVSFYLSLAILSSLNIGVRHMLPIFPFVYMLTAVGFSKIRNLLTEKKVAVLYNCSAAACIILGCISSLSAYPGYLAYYNEFVGGKRFGANVAIDSNYDWGVDLFRLRRYCKKHHIDRIYTLYFGKGNPQYYLGNRYVEWIPKKIVPPGEYIVVSVHYAAQLKALQTQPKHQKKMIGGSAAMLPEVRAWFSQLKPYDQVGDSLLIYRVPSQSAP